MCVQLLIFCFKLKKQKPAQSDCSTHSTAQQRLPTSDYVSSLTRIKEDDILSLH